MISRCKAALLWNNDKPDASNANNTANGESWRKVRNPHFINQIGISENHGRLLAPVPGLAEIAAQAQPPRHIVAQPSRGRTFHREDDFFRWFFWRACCFAKASSWALMVKTSRTAS